MNARSALLVGVLVTVAACSAPVVDEADVPAVVSVAPSAAPAPAPSPSALPSPVPPPGPDRSDLVARLTSAAASLDQAVAVSIAVLDPAGRLVFGLGEDDALLPASTAKLAAGAAALTELGPAYRPTTLLEAVGSVTDGTLVGRLELVGGGDPALSTRDYRSLVYLARPHSRLESLADSVIAAGIEEVTAGVVAGVDRFGSTPLAPGWTDGDLAVLDARRITSLTVDGGLDVTVLKAPPEPELELLGSPDPAATTARVFTEMLRRRGVTVGVTSAIPIRQRRARVGVLEGPTLAEQVRFAFERSDNHTADTLFRLVGAARGAADWQAAGVEVASVLDGLGVDTAGLALLDGSGLSRDDRVTARQLASIDRAMRAGPAGAAWRDALAVAGEEGTLRRRLRDTVAEGRFLGKTGTLDDVTAVAGTVEDGQGQPAFHVAAIANVPSGIGRFPTLVVFDDLVALLAEDAAGCVRVAPPDETAEDEFVVGGLYVDCS